MKNKKPCIAISMGDPAGIGPEITVKALNNPSTYARCKPLIVGDGTVIEQVLKICGLDLNVNRVQHPAEGNYTYGTMDLLDLNNVDCAAFRFNTASAMTGRASFKYVVTAIELAVDRKVDGTVTGPISKEAIRIAGFDFAGHTEIFAKYTHTENYAMMLVEGGFRVVHVSTHCSLLDAVKKVKKERVAAVIRLSFSALKKLGIDAPRIAVAGLNPHAGEKGLFGREEIDEILPAIEQTRREGISVDGPFPPDTIFPKMHGGQYDLVVCMYHDQGHIPTKLLGFTYDHSTGKWDGVSGVNITLGLPIVRVSVDHGVAFDKGGKNCANPQSMLQAIGFASNLSMIREGIQ